MAFSWFFALLVSLIQSFTLCFHVLLKIPSVSGSSICTVQAPYYHTLQFITDNVHTSVQFGEGKPLLAIFGLNCRGGKINCPYCPGCPTVCTDKWKFSRIHVINIIRASKKILPVKTTSKSKLDFAGPELNMVICIKWPLIMLKLHVMYDIFITQTFLCKLQENFIVY